MFLSKNNKFFFIHIPKSGGTSIVNSLTNIGAIEGHYAGMHSTIRDVEKLNPPEVEYFIAQVRNPYKRYKSGFTYAIEWAQKRLNGELPLKNFSKQFWKDKIEYLNDIKFEGWINLLVDEDKRNDYQNKFYNRHMFRPQMMWYSYHKEQYEKYKHKMKFFKLETGEIWKFIQSLGFNVQPIHVKKSSLVKIKGYTEEQAEIVYNYFKQDFEIFNYNKEDYERA